MPIPLTYPGVYIEEVPGGVRTITGTPTSIAAFVGRAPRGPSDDSQTIFNGGDFTRLFGGLAVNYPLTYAVRGLFANGGGQTVIVRAAKNALLTRTDFSIPSGSIACASSLS